MPAEDEGPAGAEGEDRGSGASAGGFGSPANVRGAPGAEGIGIIQCKVVSRPVFKSQWLDDGEGPITAPLSYLLQTLTEAMLAGATWAVVAPLILDTYTADLELVPVDLHAGAWDRIRAAVSQFWADVAAGRQPRVDYERDAETIRDLYRKDDGQVLDLRADNMLPPLLAERSTLKAEIGAREKRVVAIDTEIKSKLGAAPEAIVNGWKLTFRLQRRKETILPATEMRVLRVKESRAKGEAA